MNVALAYLWWSLLRRKTLRFCHGLRRPTTLIGSAALLALFGFLFYYRRHEIFGRLVETRFLIGGAWVMVFGSLFKGFLQRGLVFEPPDVEFLFTSPFSRRQIIFYRLFSNYLFAIVQALVVLAIFASHLAHPLLATGCLILFQIACFHLSTAVAIFAGTLPEHLHHRIRWMFLGLSLFLTAFYLRVAWGLKLAPAFLSAPVAQILFYPATTLPDAVSASFLHSWIFRLLGSGSSVSGAVWKPMFYVAGCAFAAGLSLWWLLCLKGDILEPALATTTLQAEKRRRIEHGRAWANAGSGRIRSFNLPSLRLFRGLGAIIWKNCVMACRSKRELLLMAGFGFIYTGFTAALLYLYHYFSLKAHASPPPQEAEGFHIGVALFLAALTFFLQRMVPFDFRREGDHLLLYRTLPIQPLGLAVAELVVPTALCLALQAPCILLLLIYSHFSWSLVLLVVLAYPAVALGLNSVWNLHYLLTATRRAGRQGAAPTSVGTLLVVAISFLIFYPAGWTAFRVGQYLPPHSGNQFPQIAFASALAIQYVVDVALVGLLARLFERFEVSRDLQ